VRVCSFCGTGLAGRRRHAFVTRKGALSCGRSTVQRTVYKGGTASLVKVKLACAKEALT